MSPETSYSWRCTSPILKTKAIGELRKLRKGCTRSQLKLRHQAFDRAEKFINTGPIRVSPLYMTFQNRNLPKANRDARVDIEVLRGVAFV